METRIEGCPQCHKQPQIELIRPWEVVLSCPQHGHIAQGGTVDQAVKHWNIYLRFMGARV